MKYRRILLLRTLALCLPATSQGDSPDVVPHTPHASGNVSTLPSIGITEPAEPNDDATNAWPDPKKVRVEYTYGKLQVHPETLYMGMLYALKSLAIQSYEGEVPRHISTFAPGLLVCSFHYWNLGGRSSNGHVVEALSFLTRVIREDDQYRLVAFTVFAGDTEIGRGRLDLVASSVDRGINVSSTATIHSEPNTTTLDSSPGFSNSSLATYPSSLASQPRPPDAEMTVSHISYRYSLVSSSHYIGKTAFFVFVASSLARQARVSSNFLIKTFLFRKPDLLMKLVVVTGNLHSESMTNEALIGALWKAASTLYSIDKYSAIRVYVDINNEFAGDVSILNIDDSPTLQFDTSAVS